MALFRVIFGLVCLSLVVAQDPDSAPETYADDSEYIGLRIIEIRKIQRESSPSGHEYNVRITLADHESLRNLYEWRITVFLTNSSDTDTSVPSEDPLQTVIEFEADLTNATAVMVEGLDYNKALVARTYHLIDGRVMDSKLAWVGGAYNITPNSLRVWPGAMEEVRIGAHVCRGEDAPCYYLEGDIPQSLERCQDFITPRDAAVVVNQCDEVVTHFQEINEEGIKMIISKSNNLSILVELRTAPAMIEAVVYDPEDPTRIFSPEGYHCYVDTTTLSNKNSDENTNEVICHQGLKDLGDVEKPMILLVALDKEGFVIESIKLKYNPSSPPKQDNTELIIGCVVGGICLLAIILATVVFFVKDKRSQGSGKVKKSDVERSTSSSAKYETAPTSEPTEPPSTPEEETRIEA